MTPVVDGAVLLGGASSRMGRDKAHVVLGGLPIVERVARALSPACETLYLVGGDPPETTRGHRIPDPPGPRCALRGLVAALDASRAEHVLVLATDLPLVRTPLLRVLARAPEADAVVPRDAGGLHPLCARYRREPVLALARRRLETQRLSLQGLLEALEVRFLEGRDLRAADPDGSALLNVNAPEDLRRAAQLLASGRSES